MTDSVRHIYLDETKAKGYVMVSAAFRDIDVPRKELRELILPRQRALHMKTESDSRRRAILNTVERLGALGLTIGVYDTDNRYKTEKAARAACFAAIVEDVESGSELVIDRDESLVSWDRQQLIQLTRSAGRSLTYRHATRREELLLSVPDAVAWCWARGGAWRRKVKVIASQINEV